MQSCGGFCIGIPVLNLRPPDETGADWRLGNARPAGAGGARGDGAATMRDVSFVRGQRGPRWSRSGLQVALLGCSATKPRGEALEVVERCAHELLRSSHRRLVEANASDQQL